MRPVFMIAMLLAALSCSSAGRARADDTSHMSGTGWQLERDVALPTYAFLEPSTSDLDVDVMVLMCERIGRHAGLQLRLYPSGPSALPSLQSPPVDLDPNITIEIDGRQHAAQLLFADDFVVVADASDGAMPVLSATLAASLQTGRDFVMTLRPIEASPSSILTPKFQITADLQAGIGGAAVAALHRCGSTSNTVAAGTNKPGYGLALAEP